MGYYSGKDKIEYLENPKNRKYIYNYDINGCYETALHNTKKLYRLNFESFPVIHTT